MKKLAIVCGFVLLSLISFASNAENNKQRIKGEERLAEQQSIKIRYQAVLAQRGQLEAMTKQEQQDFKELLKEQREESREDGDKEGTGRSHMTREQKLRLREKE